MSVIFKAQNHKYESLDPAENITWMSVTKFVGEFKPKFDPISASIKASKNKKSKWYGLPPEEIQGYWSKESERAMTTGTFYHDQRESDVTSLDTLNNLPVVRPIVIDGIKYAPEQKLLPGIYPEHFIYLKSAAICGQSDRVEVNDNTIDIIDFKTNKEIKKESFKNWEGISQKMLGPCSHLDDCNLNHYALQLSAYLYMILKHNPSFKPGKLILHHIKFKKLGEDKFGYPILEKFNDQPVVEEVVPYEVPYLKTEIRNMINYIHESKAQKENS